MNAGPVPGNLADLAERILATPAAGRRRLVALAGPPGAGKSTLAEALTGELSRRGEGVAAVPMDGFHLDNALLAPRGLLPRKGAPETFDADGFVAAMRRLATEDEVVLPRFDRAADRAVAGALAVGPAVATAIVEGNYLLLSAPPWDALADIWDLSVMIAPPEAELRERLVRRWLKHGLDADAALSRAEGNDLPNAACVLGQSRAADIRLDG